MDLASGQAGGPFSSPLPSAAFENAGRTCHETRPGPYLPEGRKTSPWADDTVHNKVSKQHWRLVIPSATASAKCPSACTPKRKKHLKSQHHQQGSSKGPKRSVRGGDMLAPRNMVTFGCRSWVMMRISPRKCDIWEPVRKLDKTRLGAYHFSLRSQQLLDGHLGSSPCPLKHLSEAALWEVSERERSHPE